MTNVFQRSLFFSSIGLLVSCGNPKVELTQGMKQAEVNCESSIKGCEEKESSANAMVASPQSPMDNNPRASKASTESSEQAVSRSSIDVTEKKLPEVESEDPQSPGVIDSPENQPPIDSPKDTDDKQPPMPEDPQDESAPSMDPEEDKQPSQKDLATCAAAHNANLTEIIYIRNTSLDISVTPNSIIFIEAVGNAKLKISTKNSDFIKGICIQSVAAANLALETDRMVGTLYLFGNGPASSSVQFSNDSNLNALNVELIGGHNIALTGRSLDCDKIAMRLKGASNVVCKGKN